MDDLSPTHLQVLLNQIAQGHDKAIDPLYRHYHRQLFAYITSIRDKKNMQVFVKKQENTDSDIPIFLKNLDYEINTHFCAVDDFCRTFIPAWQEKQTTNGDKKRHRPHRMSYSEIITLLVSCHRPGYRTFKRFYLNHVRKHWLSAFPHLLSYSRFIELLPAIIVPLTTFMNSRCGTSQGIAFIDTGGL